MSQHDQNIANADGATVRADINDALSALFSNSSGATTPSTTVAYQLWADTTTGLLKIRNAANSAWVTVGALASIAFGLQQQATNVASASTIDLDACTGVVVDVTGTTSITAITLAQGAWRIVRFTGILTFTNGASLVLPGAANITTAAGDYALVIGYSGSVVRCASYVKASGLGITGMGAQAANAVSITGGAIDGTPIGGTTKAAIGATTITGTGLLDVSVTGATRSGSFTSDQANQEVAQVRATSNSYTNTMLFLRQNSTAGTGFSFMRCGSDDDGSADTEFHFRGDGTAFADGSFTGSGADYQEFFEASTGQALPVGKTVVLDGDKVRLCAPGDTPDSILGVVRPKEPNKNSAVVGNTAWNHWTDKYLTDDYGRYVIEDYKVFTWTEQREVTPAVTEPAKFLKKPKVITPAVYEDVTVDVADYKIPKGCVVPGDAKVTIHQKRKLNPAWSAAHEYTPREGRPEWNLIGLLGQVQVEMGQPVNPRWLKMKDISATVELWMIR